MARNGKSEKLSTFKSIRELNTNTCCCLKRFLKTLNTGFWPCLLQVAFKKLIVASIFLCCFNMSIRSLTLTILPDFKKFLQKKDFEKL